VESWLAENYERQAGVWLMLAKKGSHLGMHDPARHLVEDEVGGAHQRTDGVAANLTLPRIDGHRDVPPVLLTWVSGKVMPRSEESCLAQEVSGEFRRRVLDLVAGGRKGRRGRSGSGVEPADDPGRHTAPELMPIGAQTHDTERAP
jgi:hypothetical protein